MYLASFLTFIFVRVINLITLFVDTKIQRLFYTDKNFNIYFCLLYL